VERTDRTVVQSVQESRTTQGAFVVIDMVVEHDRLQGLVKREQHCQTITSNQVEHQKVHAHGAEHVGLDITGGAILGLGGVGLLVATPQFSGERGIDEMGEEVASSRDVAISSAVLLLLGGAWAMGNGLMVHARTGDRHQGQPWTTIEEQSRTAFEPCGLSAPVAGVVEISRNGRSLDRMSFPEGGFDVDLRAHSRLCKDITMLGEPLRLVYHAGDETGGSVELAEHDLDACILASEIDQRLASTREVFDNISNPVEVAQVAVSLSEITHLLHALPTTDPDHRRLTDRHGALSTETALATESLFEEILLAYEERQAQAGPYAALPHALGSLAIARFMEGAEPSTWARIYEDYVDKARKDPALELGALEELLNADPATKGCLAALEKHPTGDISPPPCPDWLDRELAQNTFRPLSSALTAYISDHTSRLEAGTKRLERKVTEADFAALGASYEETDEILYLCASDLWMSALVDVCESLSKSRDEAVRVARKSHAALEKKAIARTAESWRRQFPLCRKVAAGADAFRNVTHCDASCRQIRGRIIADHEKLLEFSVPDAAWDTQTHAQVHSECRAAGCPRCP
ncbi:MAG: hypothetical protein ACNA8W_13480, partial [Bradymonadaceae bacterium]